MKVLDNSVAAMKACTSTQHLRQTSALPTNLGGKAALTLHHASVVLQQRACQKVSLICCHSWFLLAPRTHFSGFTCLPVWVLSGISYHLPAKHWLPLGSFHRACICTRASFLPPASRCSLAVADWPLRGRWRSPSTQLGHSQSPLHICQLLFSLCS